MKKLLLILLFIPLVSIGQEIESDEENTLENRINLGWAYYGRGNGISLTYDREFSSFVSAGIGLEEYFSDDEIELSYFIVTDFHLSKLLKIPGKIDLYPGSEIGFFDEDFEAHYYLGLSVPISKTIGVYTEIGSRGVFGVYMSF